MKKKLYRLYTGLRNYLYGIPVVLRVYSFFMADIPQKRNSAKLKKHGERYLRTVAEALDDSGIEAFCEFGTLLGIIRENGFIPHDEDIDMGILRSPDFSWDKLKLTLEKRGLKRLYSYVYEGSVTEETYRFSDGMHIDFFLFEIDGENMRTYSYFKDHSRTYSDPKERSVYAGIFPFIGGLQKIAFRQCEILTPQNPEKHLEAIYGPGWKVPDPNYQPDKKRNLMPELGQKICY